MAVEAQMLAARLLPNLCPPVHLTSLGLSMPLPPVIDGTSQSNTLSFKHQNPNQKCRRGKLILQTNSDLYLIAERKLHTHSNTYIAQNPTQTQEINKYAASEHREVT